MAENINFNLNVKKDDLSKSLDNATKKADGLSNALTIAKGVFAGNIATKGLEILGSAITSVVGVLGDSIKASAQQELALSNLNNALARAGNFSLEASKGLQEFASQLQSTSTFGDEVVLQNLALLQSLTRLDADGLQKATRAAADFATVLNIDLETATRLVAKAANGQVEALSRYGIQVQKGSTDTETFNNVLDKLSSNFGGAAQAKLGTYAGAVQALNNSFGDLLEPIGDAITQNSAIIAAINVAKESVVAFTNALAGNSGAFENLIKSSINVTITFAEIIFDSFDGITRAGQVMFNALTAGFKTIVAGATGAAIGLSELIALIPGLESTGSAASRQLKAEFDSLTNSIVQDAEDMDQALNGRNIFTNLSDGAAAARRRVTELSAELDVQAAKLKNQEVLNAQSENDRKRLESARLIEEEIRLAREQSALDTQNSLAAINNLDIENQFARQEAELHRIQEFDAQKLELEFQAQEAKIMAEKQGDERLLALKKISADRELAFTRQANAAEVKEAQLLASKKMAIEQANIQAAQGFLQAGIALSKQGSKEQKALATANALVNTYAAGTRAMRDYPYPANIGVLAATVATGLAQVRQINSVGGFANGGFIGGMSGATSGPDNTVASVRTGELVLNSQQQKKLFDAINGDDMGRDRRPVILEVDGRVLATVLRDQFQSGFRFQT